MSINIVVECVVISLNVQLCDLYFGSFWFQFDCSIDSDTFIIIISGMDLPFTLIFGQAWLWLLLLEIYNDHDYILRNGKRMILCIIH